jgi:hypothetical protein
MVTTMTHQETDLISSSAQVTQIQDIVESIREEALRGASGKLAPLQRDLPREDLFQRHDFVEHFKYAVAQGVAQTLAAYDERVQAIYLFDPDANPDAEVEEFLSPDPNIHLLLQVETHSAALEAFIEALDRALTRATREMPAPLFARLPSILNVNLISEADVAQGKGMASLLNAVFSRPIAIWKRAA